MYNMMCNRQYGSNKTMEYKKSILQKKTLR